MDGGVEEEGVAAPVPRDVDEADEGSVVVRAQVDQATTQDRAEPPGRVVGPRGGEQPVQILRADERAHAVDDAVVAHAKISPRGMKMRL